jgi:hypothetical protein
VAEASEELGGRVSRESTLPGLATWARVRDYRTTLMQTMGNVDIYRGSRLSTQDVIDFGYDHAVIATGAEWTREILSMDGYPVSGFEGDTIYTPDDILTGIRSAASKATRSIRPMTSLPAPSPRARSSSTTSITITWAAALPSY